ncbi:class I SAM-dependent methyltransferase [Varunaivibrio sulfuroxidans]|uniref:UbiE/COQ5 methyltransferase-like protein n=1 Tax=Varunaivibrio sulfuroxidans TaxID=1773489 RepID=A0A4R3JEU4_9PROT|nr:class I SAM-dependent methyltransferase [Varunaivibrio sulfuroxidans]TCS64327.1 ubiE/COQ5 methyltransferase-like protein [Varunaivibrio sulfuroxidans]WES31236.1 class I SAM-dependent methyltransferase [Varunaivibrio sulfuroxidans]
MREALDSGKLKTIYGHVAKRYDFQHSFFTARSDQRGRELLVDKAVGGGDMVLDCGAGTGSTGILAAGKAGESGKVVFFDASEEMLALAKEKTARTHVRARIAFRRGDMLDLPFEDDSFDVVLSTYSMCPVHDPAKGAMELYRVTKPGGRIGVAHSTDPEAPVVKWLADRVEDLVWHIPSISLGCRSVRVLPTLEKLGCVCIFKEHIGVPLWPFFVFVVEKPALPSSYGEGLKSRAGRG